MSGGCEPAQDACTVRGSGPRDLAGSQAGSQFFRLMSQNIRLLSGLQLSRQQLADIQGSPDTVAERLLQFLTQNKFV